MIEYHQYKACDVRAWLYEGKNNGLDEHVITKVRANALLQNPYVEDDTLLVVSATDGNKLVGYTAMFPDKLVHPDVMLSVATTLWVDPNYVGEFVSLYMEQILLANPIGNLIGTDAMPAAVLVDKLLGLKVNMYIKKRFVLNRVIQIHSWRSLGSWFLEPWRQYKRKKNVDALLHIIPTNLQIEYTNFIDKEAYDFICQNNDNDMMLRSQEMLNWIIRNPFRVNGILLSRDNQMNEFPASNGLFSTLLVKCFIREKMVGLYMLAKRRDDIVVLMLYTTVEDRHIVYASLLQHVLVQQPKQLWSQYDELNDFVEARGIAFHSYPIKYSFTRPKDLDIDDTKQMQGLDGDMFA